MHVPRWPGSDAASLERRITALEGIRRARVSAQTGNVLVEFDPATMGPRRQFDGKHWETAFASAGREWEAKR